MPTPSFSEDEEHHVGGTHKQYTASEGVRTTVSASAPETTVQQQVSPITTQAQVGTQTQTATKKVDAGVIISFSVPLRGGLFNS